MTIFASSTKAYWYLTRSTGAVSLVLLSVIVILGTLGPMRVTWSQRWPRFAISTLHRDLSLLVLVFLTIHIVTSVFDSFAPIGWLDAVIPLHSSYRPLWLGLGALSFDLLLALTITSLARVRIGLDRWRRIHWLAYASWPVAVLHGLGTGSDAKQSWMLWLTAACVAATVLAVVVRIARGSSGSSRVGAGWIAAALLTPLGIAVFALAGPLQRGWAGRAGTPRSVLAFGQPQQPVHPGRPVAAAPPPLRAFSAGLRGRLKSTPAPGGALLDLALALRGNHPGELRIRLAGQPIPGGGLSLVGSQVDLSAPALGSVLAGSVVQLEGSVVRARVVGSDGVALDLLARLEIDQQSGAVSGRLDVRPASA